MYLLNDTTSKRIDREALARRNGRLVLVRLAVSFLGYCALVAVLATMAVR